mmetsp:Transcript_19960/g.50625  ORF Transcript_19960/g.50625 Transcript_19960/m.50625 type:complete len:822 (-) Transcript_19960:3422-5887(-)
MAYTMGPAFNLIGNVQEACKAFARPRQGQNSNRSRRSIDTAAMPSSNTAVETMTAQARNAMSPSRARPSSLPAGSNSTLWSTTTTIKSKALGFVSSIARSHPALATAINHVASRVVPGATLTQVLQATAIQEIDSAASRESDQSSAGHGTAQHASSKHANGLHPLAGNGKHAALLSEFLAAADHLEISYAGLLADLSNIAYDITQLRESELRERHNLQLVSTSSACILGCQSRDSWTAERNAQRAGSPVPEASRRSSNSGDLNSHRISASGSGSGTSSPVLTPSVSLVNLSALDDGSSEDGSFPVLTFVPAASSPLHSHASMAEDHDWAAADAAAAADHGSPRSPRGAIELALPASSQQQQQHKHHRHPKGHHPPPAAVQLPVVTRTTQPDGGPQSPQAGAVTCDGEPPSAWFVADDPITKIRYFVIQGSTNLEHWQINMQFDPVIFEDPALGVRVHRGVYQAALRLYDDLVPLVRAHLATSPFASIALTGHSLGGSLASVIMLLLVHRGVVPADSVSPVYTFGSPAVFCGGADHMAPENRCDRCGLRCEVHDHPADFPHACQKPKGLLHSFGLSDDHIINVIMHRDIVPRAFACDYSLVADILKSWGPAFKRHSGLAHSGRKHLYYFVGRIMVLQPDSWHSFVLEPDHPMLPAGPELYTLANPAQRPPTVCIVDRPPAPSTTTTSTALERSAPRRRGLASAGEAVWELMDCPHPLDTLVEPGAYMATGSISRYHNPDNYTKALLALIGQAPHQLQAARAGAGAAGGAAAPKAAGVAAKKEGHARPHSHGHRHRHAHHGLRAHTQHPAAAPSPSSAGVESS